MTEAATGPRTPRRVIRALLLLEAATFAIAAVIHAVVLAPADPQAATEESVITIGLLIGLALSWAGLLSVSTIGMLWQAFALFGTLVGFVTIATDVGAVSVPEIAYHGGIAVVLVVGLRLAARNVGSAPVAP